MRIVRTTSDLPSSIFEWVSSPRWREAVTATAKVALDKAACLLRFTANMSLPPTEWLRIVTEIDAATQLWAERGWFDRPRAYHRSPEAPARVTLMHATSRRLKFRHLRFLSGYEPHADEPGRARWLGHVPNRTAHAWVFRHPGRPRPWLMCIHGYSFGMPFVDLDAFRVDWLHNSLGLNVILPVLPLHGPRRISWQSGDGFFRGDVLDTLHAEAQAVWDARRLLAWLRADGADCIGVYGLSLGGYTAAVLAALEPELACVIAGIPASDFVRLAQLHIPAFTQRLATQAGLQWNDVTRLYRVISPLVLEPCVPLERRYIFGGRADCIVPPEQVSAIWECWGRPRIAWYDGSHLSFLWEPAAESFVTEALHATFGSAGLAEVERAAA